MNEKEKLQQLLKMNDICLFVKDFDRAVKFYTEVFGMECTFLRRGPTYGDYAMFRFCGTELTLWSRDGINEILGEDFLHGTGGCFMIAIRVAEHKNVDELAELLIARGGKMPEGAGNLPVWVPCMLFYRLRKLHLGNFFVITGLKPRFKPQS